jgi:hypothetical protein
MSDPLGGIRGDEIKVTNPFGTDKNKAIQDLNLSVDYLEGRKRKRDKSILQQIRDGSWGKEEKIPNWEPSPDSEFDGYDVILRWAGKEVTRVRDVNKKEAKVALSGISSFLKNFDQEKPDTSNRWVAICYNITAKMHGLDLVEVPKKIDREKHSDLFNGIKGDKSALSRNQFAKDIKRAILIANKSMAFLENVDKALKDRPPELRIDSTKNCTPTTKDNNTHFDVTLFFAMEVILTERNIPLSRAKVALSSMRGWLRNIDAEDPDFDDENIKKCYQATIERSKPGHYLKVEKEMLPMESGGTSYWSKSLHCWVTGHIDKNGQFIPPDWTL